MFEQDTPSATSGNSTTRSGGRRVLCQIDFEIVLALRTFRSIRVQEPLYNKVQRNGTPRR